MKLDDLARRAAAEVKEASREARFTVRAPGSRPTWPRYAVAFAVAALVIAVAVPLLFVIRPRGRAVLESATTTQAATAFRPCGRQGRRPSTPGTWTGCWPP